MSIPIDVAILQLSAVVSGLISIYVLYLGWKRRSIWFTYSGWVGLLATLPFWIFANGSEYGVAFALGLPALYVWLAIATEQKSPGPAKTISKPKNALSFNAKGSLIVFAKVLYLLPLLMVISGILSLALALVSTLFN